MREPRRLTFDKRSIGNELVCNGGGDPATRLKCFDFSDMDVGRRPNFSTVLG